LAISALSLLTKSGGADAYSGFEHQEDFDMTTIVTLLTQGFADWETALLNAVAHGYYGVDTRFVSPGGTAVTSLGGMKVTPDAALETLDADSLDALVICGGTIWKSPAAPDITKAVTEARDKGKVVAAICDGTLALAKTGLLDTVRHTSNGAGYLAPTGYKGAAHYVETSSAMIDQNIITAPATAPITFMVSILTALGVGDDRLAYYAGLHAAEHRKP
jgi:putative intracellular protease/amidase